jgi:hypothetical protein
MNWALNLGSPFVRLGGVCTGTIIVALVLQRFRMKHGKKGGKGKDDDGGGGKGAWKELVPFFLALFYGLLAVLATSGVSALGFISQLGLWAGDNLGTLALVYGVGGTSPAVTRAQPVVLTPGGYAVYLIWTALVVGHHVWARRRPRIQSALGVVAGVCLGLSAGVAGIAAVPLGSIVNLLGAWYAGVVQ